MSILISELLGTMMLMLIGNGVVCNVVLNKTKGHNSGWIVIAVGWSMAVFVAVYISQGSSGAHLNPVVTVSLCLANKTPWILLPSYVIGQFIGATIGQILVYISYKKHFDETSDDHAILACFSTAPAITNKKYNLLTEIIATFALVLGVLYLTPPSIKILHNTTTTIPIGLGSIGALPVAFLILAIGLGLSGPTGFAINPVRDVAPRCIHSLLFCKKSKWHN